MNEFNDDLLPAPESLKQLAEAYGVPTEYWDHHGNLASSSSATLRVVLAALGVSVNSEEEIGHALWEVEDAPWRQALAPTVVTRGGIESTAPVYVPDGAKVWVRVKLKNGDIRELTQIEDWTVPREVDGVKRGHASFTLGTDLPLGWHRIIVEVSPGSTDQAAPQGAHAALPADGEVETITVTSALAIVPNHPDLPEFLGDRGWGVVTQLYSTRSCGSWGTGNIDDLTKLAAFLGDQGAGLLLINLLHAAEPVAPITHPPHLPMTRRFINPLYIRSENIPEVARLSGPKHSLMQWTFEEVKDSDLSAEPIDRDAVWKAKREAFEVIFAVGRSYSRQRDFERSRVEQGEGLERFALWSTLVEKRGPLENWPATLREADSAYIANEAHQLAERVDFFAWLQWTVDEQLVCVQAEALALGMALGIMDDLAVGVHFQRADVWSNPEALVSGVAVGAPSDMYNQQGQNWSQPPWNPEYLARSAYAPLRDMVRTVLRHAGTLRVDHIIGLFRLWWIPEGMGADHDAYMRYDHEAMLGVALLEAHRAGAVVVGEDLGTVEPWARDYLANRGVLGASVLWLERQHDGWPLQPQDYRRLALSTVNTYDFPPTAGYLIDEYVDLREHLGLFIEPIKQVRAEARIERDRMISRLRERGLLGDAPTERQIVEALHRYVVRTPSVLVGVALVGGAGERHAQNQPGTDQEYPNWRIPLTDGAGEVVLVDDLPENARLGSLLSVVHDEMASRD